MKRWFAVIGLVLCMALCPCAAVAESNPPWPYVWDMSVPIQAEDADEISVTKKNDVTLPTGTVTSLRPTNPLRNVPIYDVEQAQVQALMQALSEAKPLKRVKESIYGAHTLEYYSYDGTEIEMTYQKASGKSDLIWLESIYEKDQVMFSFIDAEEFAAHVNRPKYAYLLESKDLKQQILALCEWKTYKVKVLEDTASIRVNLLNLEDRDSDNPYVFFTEITDEKQVQELVQTILKTKATNNLYNLAANIKLEFVLSNGQIYDGYTRKPPPGPLYNALLQVGGRQLQFKGQEWQLLWDLLPSDYF